MESERPDLLFPIFASCVSFPINIWCWGRGNLTKVFPILPAVVLSPNHRGWGRGTWFTSSPFLLPVFPSAWTLKVGKELSTFLVFMVFFTFWGWGRRTWCNSSLFKKNLAFSHLEVGEGGIWNNSSTIWLLCFLPHPHSEVGDKELYTRSPSLNGTIYYFPHSRPPCFYSYLPFPIHIHTHVPFKDGLSCINISILIRT